MCFNPDGGGRVFYCTWYRDQGHLICPACWFMSDGALLEESYFVLLHLLTTGLGCVRLFVGSFPCFLWTVFLLRILDTSPWMYTNNKSLHYSPLFELSLGERNKWMRWSLKHACKCPCGDLSSRSCGAGSMCYIRTNVLVYLCFYLKNFFSRQAFSCAKT